MINQVVQYVNQQTQIIRGEAYCGAAVVAMITGRPPQAVAEVIGDTADDMRLVNYLRSAGHAVEKIVDGGTQATRWGFYPADRDFVAIRHTLEEGLVILYHFAGWDHRSSGHYAVCVGWEDNPEQFVFMDPAGDRNRGYFNEYGNGARYTRAFLRAAGIKRLFSVTV